MLLQDKTKVYITGAFSLNMLKGEAQVLSISPVNHQLAREYASQAESAICHPGLAAIIAERLGVPVEVGRVKIKLEPDTRLLVGWYSGPSLSPEARAMPMEGRLSWWLVSRR